MSAKKKPKYVSSFTAEIKRLNKAQFKVTEAMHILDEEEYNEAEFEFSASMQAVGAAEFILRGALESVKQMEEQEKEAFEGKEDADEDEAE